MADDAWASIPGGLALVEWFGRVPRFHDANLLEITLASRGPSVLRIHTWETTNKVDDRGYYILDKHVIVTITLNSVTDIALVDFDLPGIIFDFEVTSREGAYEIEWSGSYGVNGRLRAKRMHIDLQPGKP